MGRHGSGIGEEKEKLHGAGAKKLTLKEKSKESIEQ